MAFESIIWLILFIIFLVVELATVGLTSVYFSAGSLIALIMSFLGVPLLGQIIAFIIVSGVLLYFTRPFAVRVINSRHTKTNVEDLVDKVVKITERVNNLEQTGRGVLNGIDWTVRSVKEEEVLEVGSLAKVVEIQGVKLIVTPYEEV